MTGARWERRRESGRTLPHALALAMLLAAAGCTPAAAPAPPTPEPVTRTFGPLPETGRVLLQTLDEAEAGVEGRANGVPATDSPGVDAARLASLRLTRSAVDLIDENEPQRALDLLERAIAIDGGTGFAYVYIGYIHLQDGRADRAQPFIERGAALMPPYAPLENELQALRLAARMEDAAASRGTP